MSTTVAPEGLIYGLCFSSFLIKKKKKIQATNITRCTFHFVFSGKSLVWSTGHCCSRDPSWLLILAHQPLLVTEVHWWVWEKNKTKLDTRKTFFFLAEKKWIRKMSRAPWRSLFISIYPQTEGNNTGSHLCNHFHHNERFLNHSLISFVQFHFYFNKSSKLHALNLAWHIVFLFFFPLTGGDFQMEILLLFLMTHFLALMAHLGKPAEADCEVNSV